MKDREPKKFIRLQMRDKECRCCGHGREKVCDSCNNLLHSGYAVFVELKDQSTMERKKPTGFAVAVYVTPGMYNNGDRNDPITPNAIYFIRQSDLKAFMKNDYNNPRDNRGGKFLTGAPHTAHRGTAYSSRHAAELYHT